MNALTGMEKFSHLEDKIYLTIEYAKKMRDEKERLEREANSLRRDAATAIAEKKEMEDKLGIFLSERDTIQQKVEAMLEALTTIEPDIAQAVGR